MNNLAIYSVFCGPTATRTLNAAPVDPRYPHIFVSNNREILDAAAGAGWRPVFLDFDISDDPAISAVQAKLPKADPRLIPELRAFDLLCYKDDKRHLHIDGLAENVAYMKATNAALGVRPHPFLDSNILFEFAESMDQPRYKSQWKRIVTYITEEVAQGFSLQAPIFMTGGLLRDMRHPDTAAIDQTWSAHIWRCGIQCQISFDFVAQRFASIATLPAPLLLL